MKNIQFTCMNELIDVFPPTPASKNIPEWYKNIESYTGNEKKPDGNGGTNATIKKCIPVFDAITAGYLIYSQTDVYVTLKDNVHWYEWASNEAISFHPITQAINHPQMNDFPFPKWNNPWAIKTPKGYSCLFINPVHRSSPFRILEGIVDCDSYSTTVNFPFVMNSIEWQGLIPAGTPIAQVIPFKRDEFKMSFGLDDEIKESKLISKKLKTFFYDSYKNQFWHKKEYK